MTVEALKQLLDAMAIKTGWTLDGALNLLDTNPDSVALLTIRPTYDDNFYVSSTYKSEVVEGKDIIPYIRGLVHGYRSERRRIYR